MPTRTNFATRPSFDYALDAGWTEYNPSASTVSDRVSTPRLFGTSALRINMGVAADYGRIHELTLAAGTYTASLYGQMNPEITNACFMARRKSDYLNYGEVHWTAGTAGSWERKSFTFTLDATTVVQFLVGVGSYGAASKGIAYFDGLLIETGASLGDFFDGDTADTSYVDYAWTATPGASSSTATPTSTAPPTPPAPTQTPAGYTLLERSTFDGTAIDTSRWYVRDGFAGTSQCGTYSSARTTQHDGAIWLEPYGDSIPGIESHYAAVYGRWDIVARWENPTHGYKPVMLLWPSDNVWNKGEIDIEFDESDGQSFNIYVHDTQGHPESNAGYQHVVHDCTKDTKYSVEWTKTYIRFLVDDVEVYKHTSTNGIPTSPFGFITQIDVGVPGGANGVPARAGYPAVANPPTRFVISNVDIWTPAVWYPFGSPPNMPRGTLIQKTKDIIDAFWTRCASTSGMPVGMPAGAIRIARPDQGNDTVSEGMAYGLYVAARCANPNSVLYDPVWKQRLEGMSTYVRFYLDSHGLMNWRINPDGSVAGTGGATDADEDIFTAWFNADDNSLSSAAFPYGTWAVSMAEAYRDWEHVPEDRGASANIMTNGDQWGFDTNRYMPDYFAPFANLLAYRKTGDARFLRFNAKNYPLAVGYFCDNFTTGMVPDECDRSGAPIGGLSYKWSYNAVRGWRIALDYLQNGTSNSPYALTRNQKLAAFFYSRAASDPTQIAAEWEINGSAHASYTNLAFMQAVMVACLCDSTYSTFAATIIDAMHARRNESYEGYFGLSLAAVAMVIAVGEAYQTTPTTATPTELSATFGTSASFSAVPMMPHNLSANTSVNASFTAAMGVSSSFEPARFVASAGFDAGMTVNAQRPPIELAATFSTSASFGAAPSQARVDLGGSFIASASFGAELTILDTSVRPIVCALANELYEALGHALTDGDADQGWPLLKYCAVLTCSGQELDDLVRPHDLPGWAKLVDVDLCPEWALPWLAQFVGTTLAPDLDESSKRLAIRKSSGFARGSVEAIRGAAQSYLRGGKTVDILERDTSSYHYTVRVYAGEVVDLAGLQSALVAAKPAGLTFSLDVRSGLTYDQIAATNRTYNQLAATWSTYDRMKLATPQEIQ